MHSLTLIAWLAAAPLEEAPMLPTSVPPGAAADAMKFDLLKYVDRIERDGTHVRTQDVKVRLNSAQWVSIFGQLGSLYLEGYGDVQFEDVVIEKGDGRRIAVTNAIVEDVNPYGVTSTSLSADLRFKKLTIPGLEPGDRLSYRMVQRQKPLAPGRVFGEIKLSAMPDSSPQTYELDVPRDAGIKVRLREGLGVEWEEVPSAPDRYVRRFVLKPPPAGASAKAGKEDLESLADPDVIFTSFDSWNEVARWWWGISKDRLLPDAGVTREAQALTTSARTQREKVSALHAFTSARIRYLNVSFGLGRMQPRKAAEVLANRFGDCKDKHALLAALSSSVGIDVRPVLINSSQRVLRDDVPSPQQFDHVISVARLGAKAEEWLWLDATNPFAAPGHLLPNLRDKSAVLVEANGDATVVRTPKLPPFVPRQEMTLKATLSPDGVLRGRVAWLFHSDDEAALRSVFAMLPQERRADAIQASLAREWRGGKVENVSVSDPLDVASAFRVEFDAEQTIKASEGERKLSVPAPEFELPEADSGASAGGPAARFGVREFTLRAEIELPEGQQAQLPLSVSLDRPFGSFRSSYAVEGRALKLERTLSLGQPEIAAADVASYEAFRSAISKDHDQAFSVSGMAPVAAAPSAAELHKEGTAALDRKEYDKAVELLRMATELDPKVADGFFDLGRALSDLHKYEEAVAALTRQVELEPFHERAYGWRGYALEQLHKWVDAERDLRKQIEVAPFNEWPYEELARWRSREGKHQEAAELYAQAAAIEPKTPQRWLDLAQEQDWARRPQDARQSLQKATSLELQDWMKIRAAGLYRALGDLEPAGRLAGEALPSVAKRLAKLQPAELDSGDAYWLGQLVEGWRLIGEAAAAAGDSPKAEKYLDAAWRLQFVPEAGWALGELREKQGRLAEAVELWSMAAGVAGPWTSTLPANRQKRIEAACAKLPEVDRPGAPPPRGAPGAHVDVYAEPARQSQARARLTELRTVRLKGPVVADLTEQVVLLAGVEGRVERVIDVSRKSPKEFERQLANLEPIRIAMPQPDEHGYKAVRRGLFTCFSASGCALVLDLPEQPETEVGTKGTIRLTSVEPKQGTTLQRGERVTVVAKVHYEVSTQNASIRLVVALMQPTDRSRAVSLKPLVETKDQALSAGEGDATLTAMFTAPTEPGRIHVLIRCSTPGVTTEASWLEVR